MIDRQPLTCGNSLSAVSRSLPGPDRVHACTALKHAHDPVGTQGVAEADTTLRSGAVGDLKRAVTEGAGTGAGRLGMP